MSAPGTPVTTRLWQYQAERFPLARNGALIGVFAAAGVTLSAVLGGRPLPPFGTYAAAAVVALGLFFQLRVCDEMKDAAEDARFRPERPVPRGLVSLRLLGGLAVSVAVVQAALALLLGGGVLLLLAAVWGWMALMAAEFFAPAWLRRRPLLYLASHMAVMPLIDLWITAAEWWPGAGTPPAGLLPVLALSFANGCVLEIGRKTWCAESERPGVETYSALWGGRTAATAWLGCLVAAASLIAAAGAAAGVPRLLGIVALVALAGTAGAGFAFRNRPTRQAQVRLDRASGLWVLASYAATGVLPWLARGSW